MKALGSSGRRVAKNTASRTLGGILGQGAKSVAAVLVARSLGPEGLGSFSVALAIAGFAAVVAPLGLDYLVVRDLNRRRGSFRLRDAMEVATAASLAGAAAVLLLPRLLGAGADFTATAGAAALYVALSGPSLVLLASFHADERMELETVAHSAEGAVSLGLVAAALAAGLGAPVAVLAFGAGRLANLATAAVLHRRFVRPRDSRGGLGARRPLHRRRLVAAGLPMGLATIFTAVISRTDILVLGALAGDVAVGLYAAASVVVLSTPAMAFDFTRSLYPVLARADDVDDPRLREVFAASWRSLLVLGVAAAAGLAVLAGPLLQLVYGEAFSAATPLLLGLAGLVPLRMVNSLAGVTLNATDRERVRTRALGAAAAVGVAVTAVGVAAFGVWGAVLGLWATDLTITALFLRGLRPLRPPLAAPAVEGLALALPVAAAVAATPGHVTARVAIGGAVFLAGLGIHAARLRHSLPGSTPLPPRVPQPAVGGADGGVRMGAGRRPLPLPGSSSAAP